jgi:peptidoglycan/xylan/chitin deacetylase (PgdA/CDA1 family)
MPNTADARKRRRGRGTPTDAENLLVLCYHAVSPTWSAPLSVKPEALERQLTWLLRNGWHGATFSEAVDAGSRGRTFVVTFDDAFASVLAIAHPILSGLGLRATAFVPTAFMSGQQPLSWSGIEHWLHTPSASELAPMTWRDLGVLVEAGWEIGSHTQSHPHLTQLNDTALSAELSDSRAEIIRQLGVQCEAIAYPYGDSDERVVNMARNAGYSFGAGLSRRLRPASVLSWPRVGVYNRDSAWRFRAKASPTTRWLRGRAIWPRGRDDAEQT